MSRYDICIGIADADERLTEVFLFEPGCPHQGAMGRSFHTRFDFIAAHFSPFEYAD
jgi:hypothetical protein